MPKTKAKKKVAKKASTVKSVKPTREAKTKRLELKIAHLSDRLNGLLVVFAIGMMLLAYALVKTYSL